MNILDEIMKIPVISAHEHISSIASFGNQQDIFFPSDVVLNLEPIRDTSLKDIFLSPYYGGVFHNIAGDIFEEIDFDDFRNYYQKILKFIDYTKTTGTFRALNRALMDLYKISPEDIYNVDAMCVINEKIQENYRNFYKWSARVLKKSNTQALIKPVHPQYIRSIDKANCKIDEMSYTYPVARVDSLIGTRASGILDFNSIGKIYNTQITTLNDIMEIIDVFFNEVSAKAVGIKQLQAYYRTLHIKEPTYQEAKKSFEICSKKVSKEDCVIVGDFIMRKILEYANIREFPYQIHTGMTNLINSNPMHLEELIQQYPNVKFVLLHCYPFVSEASYLARVYKNCFIDTSWLMLQGENILARALEEYLSMVPYNKITISVDATSIEEYYGGIMISREKLAEVLYKLEIKGCFKRQDTLKIAGALLADNTKAIYKL